MRGHPVLRYIDRFLITLIEEFRSPVKYLRSHRPLDGSLREARIAVYTDRIAVFIRTNGYSIINILTVEIQRLRDQLQIFLQRLREILTKALHDIFRILSQKDRIGTESHIPACRTDICLRQCKACFSGSLNILLRICRRIIQSAAGGHSHTDRTDCRFTDRLYAASMGFQDIMPDGEIIMRANLQARCMFTGHITKTDRTLRLIEGKEMADAVRKMGSHELRILIKPFRRLRIQPAASLMKRIGKIPVIQRHIRLNAVFNEAVYKMIIIGETFLIDLSGSFRQDPGPVYRKTVRLQSHLFHDRHIFFVTVVLITGHITCMMLIDMTVLFTEYIPDVQSFSIFISGTFHLIGSGCGSPYEIFSEAHIFVSFHFSDVHFFTCMPVLADKCLFYAYV